MSLFFTSTFIFYTIKNKNNKNKRGFLLAFFLVLVPVFNAPTKNCLSKQTLLLAFYPQPSSLS